MTDRAISFVNEVAERVSRVYPDRQIEMYAYGSTTRPPTRSHVHPSVLIKYTYWSCSPAGASLADTQWQTQTDSEKCLNRWIEAGAKHFGLYDYGSYLNPDCPIFWFFPIADSPKVFHEKWSFRHYLGENDNTFGPSLMVYNLRARALWNRNIDYRQEIHAICRAFYGPAAAEMYDYYMLMHDALLDWRPPTTLSLPYGLTKDGQVWLGHVLEYDLPIMAKGQAALDRAVAKVAGDQTLEVRVGVAQFGHSLFTLWLVQRADPQTRETVAAAKAAHERAMKLFPWGESDRDDVNLVLPGTRDALVDFRLPPLVETTVMELPLVWTFKTDPEKVGAERQWYRPAPDHAGEWVGIRTDKDWTEQGHSYHGVAWYRVEVTMPAEARESLRQALGAGRAALLFKAVDGTADIYLDGEKIGEQKISPVQMWDKPFAIPLPATFDAEKSHPLAVRVEKDSDAAGIWKPVSIIVEDQE